jgi:aldehyde dehydrogenase
MATTMQRSNALPAPGDPDSPVIVAERYGNFIGGVFVEPVEGRYRENLTPVTGAVICEVADSTPADVELALDAAHAAKDDWAKR